MKILSIIVSLVVVLGIAGWLGLPVLFKTLGVHPHYTGSVYQLPGGRALIVTTSHDELGDGGKETGVFGSELTVPYYTFLDGGMTVDVASIQGGEIPIDPLVTGQNQNAGSETAQKMMRIAGGSER